MFVREEAPRYFLYELTMDGRSQTGIAAHSAQADSMMDDILAFVESSTEAEIFSVDREMR